MFWLVGGLLAFSTASAEQQTLVVDGDASTVRFTLDATGHTVTGELFFESGEIHFDPEAGSASGTLRLDARRAVTHNDKRDAKMHETVLESERHPWIEFEVNGVEGPLPADSNSTATTLRLRGIITLLGRPHPITVPVRVTRTKSEIGASKIGASASLTVPYVDWGLHDPSVFVLRVAKEVQVEVHLIGRLVEPPDPSDLVGSEEPREPNEANGSLHS